VQGSDLDYQAVVGQDSVFRAFVDVDVRRQPYLRTASVAGDATVITNAIGAREMQITNAGNAPALTTVKIVPESGAKFGQARIAVRSKGNLTEFASTYSFECEGATQGTNTSSGTTATGYSGTGASLTTFASDSMLRRWKKTISLTDATALEGKHKPLVRIKPYDTGASTTLPVFKMGLRWGLTDTDPIAFSNDVVELDFTDVDVLDWIEVDLGEIAVAKGAKTLILEFWAQRVSGDYGLASDYVHLYPSDESFTTVSVPGLRFGAWGKQKWRGDELVTAAGADTREQNGRTNANNEILSTPPSTGLSLAAGIYEAEIDCTVYGDKQATQFTAGEFRVYNITDTATLKKVNIKSRKNRAHVRRKRKFTFEITAAHVSGSKKFDLRFIQTSADADTKVLVHRLRLSFLNTITENHTLTLDGFNRQAVAKLTSTGATIFPVNAEGAAFPELPPGTSTLVFQWGDIPTDPGYDDVDVREPHARIVVNRSATVTVDHIPRWTH
jgi:hypothetical protein